MISQTSIEILLLTFTSLTTGFLIFATGVFQKIMNNADEATFKHLLAEMTGQTLKNPFIIGLSVATMLGMIPYFYSYGLSNWWFTAGLFLWILTSVISKQLRLPIYKRVAALKESQTEQLKDQRTKLQKTSTISAVLSIAIVVLMVIGVV